MGGSDGQKRLRKAMRNLVTRGYERELSKALSDLEASFRTWREGTITCFQLSDLIHEHHDGVSRDLWKKYGFHAEVLLPGLVASGVILESEVPEELLATMQQKIRGIREFQENRSQEPETTTDPGSNEDQE